VALLHLLLARLAGMLLFQPLMLLLLFLLEFLVFLLLLGTELLLLLLIFSVQIRVPSVGGIWPLMWWKIPGVNCRI